MPKIPSHNLILVIDDDPNSTRRIQSLAGHQRKVQTRFADTINAVSRTLESEPVCLIVICVNDDNLALIEPIVHQSRRLDTPLPVVAGVNRESADHALAAVEAGADCTALLDDDQSLGLAIRRTLDHASAHRKAAESSQRLEEIESRYTLLLDSSREALAYVHEGLHVYCNGAYIELFGFDGFEDVEGLSILDLFTAGDSETDLKAVLRGLANNELPEDNLEFVAHQPNGETFNALVTFSPARFNREDCIQILVREQVVESDPGLAREIEKLRTTDAATGLMNRQVFMEQVTRAMENQQQGVECAVLFVELTDYPSLLNKIGIGSADALIKQAAQVVSHQAGEEDMVSRVRDNTFALLVKRDQREEVETLARHLLDAYSGHILQVRDRSLTVSAAVGMTYIGQRSLDAEEILHQADDALTEALRAGGNCFVRYRPRVETGGGEEDEQWADRLRHALDNNELLLVEQPILDLEKDEPLIQKVETRLRPDESEELYLPDMYMPAAIRKGLATSLDRDLVERLLDRIAADETETFWMLPVSSASISDTGFHTWMQEQIDQGKLPGQRLIFQFRDTDIRETLLDAQRFIQRFAARGCHFSLADVNHETPLEQLLKHLDLDYLELRPETTENLSADEDRRQELSEVVSAIQERNIRIVAPRVHNTNDMASLWQFGITLVQGEFEHDEAAVGQA